MGTDLLVEVIPQTQNKKCIRRFKLKNKNATDNSF